MKAIQSGFINMLAIALVVTLLVAASGIFVYRSQHPKNAANATNKASDQVVAQQQAPQSTVQPTVEVKPVETPKPNNVTTAKPSTITPTTNSVPQAQPTSRVIAFNKGGGGQNGDVVFVSADLSEAQSGTCTYKFSLNGTVRVQESNVMNASKRCSISIPVSRFPKSAIYSFSLSFMSNDGLVTATQSPYDIVVN